MLKEDQDGTTKYGYDKSNRLITAAPVPFDMAGAEGFVYDKNGNRRFDRGAKDYKYDAANRVLNNSVYTYTHDQNGNLASRTEIASSVTVTYAYTPEQQLSEVITPKDKLEYKYDPIGRRTGRTINNSTTHYVYDGQDIIAELDEAGNQINTYTNGPGIDEPLVMTKADGKAYYYHADALGSITAITDDNRKLAEAYSYKSYGQPTIKDAGGQIIAKSSVGNLRMFAAREYEPEIGFYNNRHRYLDPSRGAFTQEDPSWFESGEVNLFVYAQNNPHGYVDPTGKIVTVIGGAIGGLVVGVGTDIAIQATTNLLSGKSAFVDINWVSVAVSGVVGAAFGATGSGLLVESEEGISAYRAYRVAQANIDAREVAIAAGKFRNTAKTLIQIEKRNEALVDIFKSSSLGALEPLGAHAYTRIYEDCSSKNSH